MEKQCCICFFGAMRTLPKTIDNLKGVIQQFRNLYNVKIFVHSWKGENFELLEPDYYRTTDQQEQFKNLKMPEGYEENEKRRQINFNNQTTIDEWHEKTKKFFFTTYYATYSKKQVTLLALSKIPNPEIVVYIRPDSFFKTLNVPSLLKLFKPIKKLQVITPNFANGFWNSKKDIVGSDYTGKRGANDRFAICYGEMAARVYGSQYDHLNDLLKTKITILGELILEWVFNHYKVENIRAPICLYLVRSDGRKIGFCRDDPGYYPWERKPK
jgi:hypothetical protein